MAGVDFNAMLEKHKELEQIRKDQEEVISEINKLHKKLQSTPDVIEKTGDVILLRLRSLYLNARDLAEKEANLSMTLLNQLEALQQSGTSAPQRRKMEVGEQKKKRMKTDPELSRFPSASIRSQLEHAASLKGEQVAARVTNDDDRTEWFVVKVIHFDREAKEFEVLDEDPGDDEESIQNSSVYQYPHVQNRNSVGSAYYCHPEHEKNKVTKETSHHHPKILPTVHVTHEEVQAAHVMHNSFPKAK